MPKQPETSSFLLSKWYLDCVSEEGRAFIGYAATLRWKALSLHYSSALVCRPDQPLTVISSWKDTSVLMDEPASSIRWMAPSLGIEGTWSSSAHPFERTLLESASGSIRWRCLQPRATCRIALPQGEQIDGLGYAEHLTLSIPPWRLPIDELRWGRFLSNRDAMVWIDWRGAVPLTLVLHNGILIDGARVSDRAIALPKEGASLAFEERRVLREGPLIQTALSTLPGIKKLLPLQSLQTYECKWLSRGCLIAAGTESRSGWAIHEVVRFSQQPSTGRLDGSPYEHAFRPR